ncbi:MAG: RAD55 family ATPase [Candidatus Kariarchaeaceae archaeon]|jgi:circadian clock protein KaiC
MKVNNIISTGISGLDSILNGGFIRNRTILLQGNAGTGKSTFAMQFLVNGVIMSNEPGLMLLMEYDIDDIIDDMSSFGWPIKELITSGMLKIVTPPGGLESESTLDVNDLINLVHKEVGSINAKRVVIDSLNSLEVSMGKNDNIRKEMVRFITLIRDLNCTTLLISEIYDEYNSEFYSYITHGVVSLFNKKVGANRLRAIEILKMRGMNHSTLTHSMNIQSNKGIEVLPHEIDLT